MLADSTRLTRICQRRLNLTQPRSTNFIDGLNHAQPCSSRLIQAHPGSVIDHALKGWYLNSPTSTFNFTRFMYFGACQRCSCTVNAANSTSTTVWWRTKDGISLDSRIFRFWTIFVRGSKVLKGKFILLMNEKQWKSAYELHWPDKDRKHISN